MASQINVESGVDVTIKELTETVATLFGCCDEIIWDKTKPYGTKRKVRDSEKLNRLGWRASVDLYEGLKITYEDFKKSCKKKQVRG